MKISTIILNWNRLYLLKETIASLFATVDPQHRLYIVDNGSSDGSQEFIQDLASRHPRVEAILHTENLGGEALNSAFLKTDGDLIHISENDQIYLPGWVQHVRDAFSSFSNLGQMSLFGPVPSDGEAANPKPSNLIYSRGKVLYAAHGNCGTSCILRAELVRTAFIRVYNIPNEVNEFHFPDDGRLSSDIKAAGYICAFSDRYYVKNAGHYVDELVSNLDYYTANYRAKPWLTESGFKHRLCEAQSIPAPKRSTHLFPGEFVSPEKTVLTVGCLKSSLWSMFDGFTAEIEVLEFLYALVRASKPLHAMETGTWLGYSATAIALALRDNGFGHFTTVEKDSEVAIEASVRLERRGLSEWVDIVNMSSLEYIPDCTYQLCVFDSQIDIRTNEFLHFLPWLSPGAIVIFHDTAPHHVAVGAGVREFVARGYITGIDLPTPRGLFIGRVAANVSVDALATEAEVAVNRNPLDTRIVHCCSAGRSGTAALAAFAAKIQDIAAEHEPEPKYQWQTPRLQSSDFDPLAFVRDVKAPAVASRRADTYIETSHLLHKGFAEAWFTLGYRPDLIVLRRQPALIARSLFSLGFNFTEGKSDVIRWLVHPEDRRRIFFPLPDWKTFNDYQLCLWYALEIERRARHYIEFYKQHGCRTIETNIDNLKRPDETHRLADWLGAEGTDTVAQCLATLDMVHNPKTDHRVPERVSWLAETSLGVHERPICERYIDLFRENPPDLD